MLSISDKSFNIYWPLAGLLSLVLLLLALADIDEREAAWKSRLDLLSQQQQLEWQRQQAQMGQKLLAEAQPLLMDAALIKRVHQVFAQQQTFPSQDTHSYQEQQAQLYESFDPYWQNLQQKGISELNLHFAPGLGVLHMSRPGLLADALGDARPEVLADGGIFFPRDVHVLAQQIRDIEADPSRVAELRRMGPERIRANYTWEKIAGQYDQLFREVAAR